MATLFDKDGNEVEALTADEQEEFKTKAIDEFKAANPDFENVEELKNNLTTAQKELEDLKKANEDKDGNIKGARDTITKKEREIEELKGKMEESVSGIKKFVIDKTVSELIKKVTNGDSELAKKVRHNYDKTLSAMAEDTDEQIQVKVTAALKLSSDTVVPVDPITQVAGSGDAGGGGSDSNKPSSGLVQLGEHFGINAEDWKKYGGKK